MKQALGRRALLVGLLCALVEGVSACSCAEAPFEEEFKSYRQMADVGKATIYAGRVIHIQPLSSLDGSYIENYEVTFGVSQLWAGKPQRFLTLQTDDSQHGCGFGFQKGQEYLVYASGAPGDMTTSGCSPTKGLAGATADLILLGPPIYEPNPKPRLLVAIGATLVLGGAGLYWQRRRSREPN